MNNFDMMPVVVGLPVAELFESSESKAGHAFYNEIYPTHGEPLKGPLTNIDLLNIFRAERFKIINSLEVLFNHTWEDSLLTTEIFDEYEYLVTSDKELMRQDPAKRYYLLIEDMEFRVRKLCKFIKHMMGGQKV